MRTHQLSSPVLEALHVLQGQRAAAAAVVAVLYAHQRRPGAMLIVRPAGRVTLSIAACHAKASFLNTHQTAEDSASMLQQAMDSPCTPCL